MQVLLAALASQGVFIKVGTRFGVENLPHIGVLPLLTMGGFCFDVGCASVGGLGSVVGVMGLGLMGEVVRKGKGALVLVLVEGGLVGREVGGSVLVIRIGMHMFR